MARLTKKGLDYYPFDTDFFSDIKIRKLIKRQGGKAITVYACVLCFIYKNGYYMGTDNEFPFLISEMTGLGEEYIQKCLECCFSLGLFDKKLHDEMKIITSKGIQERYAKICSLTKKRSGIEEFNLLTTSDSLEIITETMPIITETMQQRKEKESKVKESKVKKKEKEKEKSFRFFPPSFEEVQNYCLERGNNLDANIFIDFYTAKNWMIGKNKMKDWRAAVRTWEKRTPSKSIQYETKQKESVFEKNLRAKKESDEILNQMFNVKNQQ